jgi:hypothetical protein
VIAQEDPVLTSQQFEKTMIEGFEWMEVIYLYRPRIVTSGRFGARETPEHRVTTPLLSRIHGYYLYVRHPFVHDHSAC